MNSHSNLNLPREKQYVMTYHTCFMSLHISTGAITKYLHVSDSAIKQVKRASFNGLNSYGLFSRFFLYFCFIKKKNVIYGGSRCHRHFLHVKYCAGKICKHIFFRAIREIESKLILHASVRLFFSSSLKRFNHVRWNWLFCIGSILMKCSKKYLKNG